MRNSILFFCLLLATFQGIAQHKVKVFLDEKTALQHDSIYIVGTFSNWDSTPNPAFRMKPVSDRRWMIELNLPEGPIRYKFHRGSWQTVEKGFNGEEIADRNIVVHRDTTLSANVRAWRDQVILDKHVMLGQALSDTDRIRVMVALAANYAFYPEIYNADSALLYAQQAMKEQQAIASSAAGQQKSYNPGSSLYPLQEVLAVLLHALGNYPKALELRLSNLAIAEAAKDPLMRLQAQIAVVNDYMSMKDYEKVLLYSRSSNTLIQAIPDVIRDQPNLQWSVWLNLSTAFYNLQQYDSALTYAKKTEGFGQNQFRLVSLAFSSLLIGDIYRGMHKDDLAFRYYRQTIPAAAATTASAVTSNAYIGLAQLFQRSGNLDSALYYAKNAVSNLVLNRVTVQSWGENSESYIADFAPVLANLYQQKGQSDSAYKYLQWSVTLKDSLYNNSRVRQIQTLTFNDELRRQQLEQRTREAEARFGVQVKIYGLIALLAGILVVAAILFRNNKHKQAANELLQKQKQEIETTLGELRQTQRQLVQSEKMASLGELTAGIAHEIQNPLNFVNNFAEINLELIGELNEERSRQLSDRDTALENDLIRDIEENSGKILHHGKRADGIVKGMLQHSRANSGTKEPTDINALADEYLRLAYHGLRARDKSFNATMNSSLDPGVGKVNVMPQEMGRVLLNLITNAFYAANQRRKEKPGFEPVISVTTKRISPSGNKPGFVEISVRDNGAGIAPDNLEKIFQPFFTTKPTGEGTGLGLSLSYDIVKSHGGTLTVDTKQAANADDTNAGTTFTVTLPV